MRIVCHLIFRKNSFTIGSIKSDDCISKLVDAIKEMIQKKRSIINIIHLALYLYVIYDYNIIQRRSINYLFYIYIYISPWKHSTEYSNDLHIHRVRRLKAIGKRARGHYAGRY